jgi:hypothetical protein
LSSTDPPGSRRPTWRTRSSPAATNEQQTAIAERLKAKSRYYEVAHDLARLASRCACDEEGKKHFRRLLGAAARP